MSHESGMVGSVAEEVQAALLNSECYPADAASVALREVLEFAHSEAGMSPKQLEALCRELIHEIANA